MFLHLKAISQFPHPSHGNPDFPVTPYCSSGLVNQQKPTLPHVLQGQFDYKCDFGHMGHVSPLTPGSCQDPKPGIALTPMPAGPHNARLGASCLGIVLSRASINNMGAGHSCWVGGQGCHPAIPTDAPQRGAPAGLCIWSCKQPVA